MDSSVESLLVDSSFFLLLKVECHDSLAPRHHYKELLNSGPDRFRRGLFAHSHWIVLFHPKPRVHGLQKGSDIHAHTSSQLSTQIIIHSHIKGIFVYICVKYTHISHKIPSEEDAVLEQEGLQRGLALDTHTSDCNASAGSRRFKMPPPH